MARPKIGTRLLQILREITEPQAPSPVGLVTQSASRGTSTVSPRDCASTFSKQRRKHSPEDGSANPARQSREHGHERSGNLPTIQLRMHRQPRNHGPRRHDHGKHHEPSPRTLRLPHPQRHREHKHHQRREQRIPHQHMHIRTRQREHNRNHVCQNIRRRSHNFPILTASPSLPL